MSPRITKDTVLGIDLGTTNTLVAVHDGERPVVLHPDDGSALLPSVVAFLEDGTELVGDAARALALQIPAQVVHSAKRLIGRSLSELRIEAARLPYGLVAGPRQEARLRIRLAGSGQVLELGPEEVSARVLRAAWTRALSTTDLPRADWPTRAVVTVPAYFDDAQRQATRRAARIAGLEVLRLVNEPTAAALAYGLGQDTEGRFLVYDLGGGTFDVSVLRATEGVFRVLATHGDTRLGGDDFDRVLLDWMLDEIRRQTGAEAGVDVQVLATLHRSAEAMKVRLSTEDLVPMRIAVGGGTEIELEMTRAGFEDRIRPLLERTLRSVDASLVDAGLTPTDIDAVVLVGGSTRIPLVRRLLEERFGMAPRTGLDPDLAVALGAAVQASILSGRDDDVLLLDVVPLSLGIETLGGAFDKLVLRNSTVPCAHTEEFTTQVDDQTGIQLHVYQGERELVGDCRHIGDLELRGIPPMKAGLPRVAVTFAVDADALLRVTARELRSGQTASAELQPTLGLGDEDVQRIVTDSIERAGEDFAVREALELRNKGRALIRGTRQVLDAGGAEGLAPEQTYAIRKALQKVEQGVDGEDVRALHQAVERLGSLTMQLADEMIGASVRRALSTGEEQG